MLNISVFAEENAKTTNNYNIKLDTESEINNALNEIKSDNNDTYKYLSHLKETNSTQFKSRLYNAYFSLKHKKETEKKIPLRELGYREKVKLSDKKINDLIILYKKSKDETKKTMIKNDIKNAAEERYLIELTRKEKQYERENNRLLKMKKQIENFKNSKDTYIRRIITKTSSY